MHAIDIVMNKLINKLQVELKRLEIVRKYGIKGELKARQMVKVRYAVNAVRLAQGLQAA